MPLTATAREAARLTSLSSYRLDRSDDACLSHLVRLAAATLDMPMAAITIVDADRHWFKSTHGFTSAGGPRKVAFCDHVVRSARALHVPDTRRDARFAANPIVTSEPGVRAYAGAPLIGRDGLPLGALCGLDTKPRPFSAAGTAELDRLAHLVSELLDLRRTDREAGLAAAHVLTDSHRLRAAIERDELAVHYQPVIDLVNRRLVGLEALVRWQHPDRGLLPPSEFLPLAERSGLITAVDQHVLHRASAQLAEWQRHLPAARDLHVAVNVSGRQLADPGAAANVLDTLSANDLPASALTIELTETALVDGAHAERVLTELRTAGVTLSLDDFGTGYSSLAYLQRFAVDQVKLDRCFVDTLTNSSTTSAWGRLVGPTRGQVITRATVALATELGCQVVAEGVERGDQVPALRALGCRYAQGYLFSVPRPAEEIETRLRRRC